MLFRSLSQISCSHAELDAKYLDKVSTLDSAMITLYEVISGPAGETRNWELFSYLFKSNAKLIPSGKNKEGLTGLRFMSPREYIESSGKWLEENGFFEKEIHREVQQFGPMAHVFSTYEARRAESDSTPFMRGINSIQLLWDEKRWWVVNIYWTNETEEYPLSERYLRPSR